jgi:ethanolamine utilization protein EutA
VFDQPRRERFAAIMADVLLEVVRGGALSPLARQLLLTEPLHPPEGIGAVVFSGGVSEYIYQREAQEYGDSGPFLAAAIRARLSELPPLRQPTEGIRATVIGAGEYTVQVSGNTSFLSTPEVLPVHGLKVVRALDPSSLQRALAKFDLDRFTSGLALAVAIDGQPTYRSVRGLAESVAALVADAAPDVALFLVLDADIAVSLGGILVDELGLARPVIAIDGIDVGDLDYIDIGRPMGASQSVPVTVKSLLFPH